MSERIELVVQFQFISAACIEAGVGLCMTSEHRAASSVRFATDYESDDPPFALVIDARGSGDSVEQVRTNLSNVVASSAHVVAIAANATVGDAFKWSTYEPKQGGAYTQTFHVVPPAPATARRTVDADAVIAIFGALDEHSEYQRMRRTMENYAEALRVQRPGGPIQGAMYLFIAVEILTDVIIARLRETHGVSSSADLAVALGLSASNSAGQLNGQIRGHIRRTEVFTGDDDLHRRLKKISDGMEHGFMDFAEARDLSANTFHEAAAAVRRAVLHELGLAQDVSQKLLVPPFAEPLPLRPLQATFEGRLVLDDADHLLDEPGAPFLDFPTRAKVSRNGFDASEDATEWTLNLTVDPDPGIGRVHVTGWQPGGAGRLEASKVSPASAASEADGVDQG